MIKLFFYFLFTMNGRLYYFRPWLENGLKNKSINILFFIISTFLFKGRMISELIDKSFMDEHNKPSQTV